MEQEVKYPAYNHEADKFVDAVGVDRKELDKKISKFLDDRNEDGEMKVSQLVESFENGFTKRELAVWAFTMADEMYTEKANPLLAMLKGMAQAGNIECDCEDCLAERVSMEAKDEAEA